MIYEIYKSFYENNLLRILLYYKYSFMSSSLTAEGVNIPISVKSKVIYEGGV